MNFQTFITVFFGSVVGGAFVNFVFELGKRMFDEYLYKRRLDSEDNRQLAGRVIDVIVEGTSQDHTKAPKNGEQVLELAARLQIVNRAMSFALRSYYYAWELFYLVKENESPEDRALIKVLEKELKDQSTFILNEAKKLKK
jgi:phosphoribosyl 1,2-cyclic phosphodiesterase